MPRAITVGNGHVLATFDEVARLRDLYFPYIGHENQLGGHLAHRIAVHVDNHAAWLDGPGWEITQEADAISMVGHTKAVHRELGVTLLLTDVVYNEKNIVLRRVAVTNNKHESREIKVFFYQQFELYASRAAHTAYYSPKNNVIIHYRNRRVILINAHLEGEGFSEYATGVYAQDGKEGTFRDVEDGHLSKNPIEHGMADSAVGLSRRYEDGEEKTIYYWLCLGRSIAEAEDLNIYVLDRSPEHLVRTTHDFWKAWSMRRPAPEGLSPFVQKLYSRSLLVIRAHTGQNGSIIASADSAMLQNGKDTYGYVWPRDAALIARSLDMAGETAVSRRFFEFAREAITREGYFMHKYSPDGSLGSSWHPWVRDGVLALPIQEDETALVLWALWRHYEINKDIEFIEEVYNTLIRPAADFMTEYRDQETGLPLPSYDLWEERFGTTAFTSASVYGALFAAAQLAEILGKLKSRRRYMEAAEVVKAGIEKYLWNDSTGTFRRAVTFVAGQPQFEETLDASSAWGMVLFGVFSADDPRVFRAMMETKQKLSVDIHRVSGIVRYRGDGYYSEGGTENPWIITALWMAQYHARIAHTKEDLDLVIEYLEWAAKNATPSGMLPEQVNFASGRAVSATPLVWSHAEFVATVHAYTEAVTRLGLL